MLFRYCLPSELTCAARSYTCALTFVSSYERSRVVGPHRGPDDHAVLHCVLACISYTYYYRRTTRKKGHYKYNYNKPTRVQSDRKMHLVRGRSGNESSHARGHVSHACHVRVIKGRGRKLCIPEITIRCRYYGIALER